MTYVVTENCNEGATMLVIHPDECIDCGAEGTKADTEPWLDRWVEVTAQYAPKWPDIQPIPLKAGSYVADFGPLGRLSLSVS